MLNKLIWESQCPSPNFNSSTVGSCYPTQVMCRLRGWGLPSWDCILGVASCTNLFSQCWLFCHTFHIIHCKERCMPIVQLCLVLSTLHPVTDLIHIDYSTPASLCICFLRGMHEKCMQSFCSRSQYKMFLALMPTPTSSVPNFYIFSDEEQCHHSQALGGRDIIAELQHGLDDQVYVSTA